jgi:hypothetical protein
VTISGTELIAIAALVVIGLAVIYLLVLSRVKAMVTERHLMIAEQFGALDDAIRALETRLTEHQVKMPGAEVSRGKEDAEAPSTETIEDDLDLESGEIAPEIQAAIAAATVAAVGPDAVVQSVKPVPSPWSQQGRVMVQGGHNLRVGR